MGLIQTVRSLSSVHLFIYLLSCVYIDTDTHFSFVVSVIIMSARQEQLLQAQTMVEQLRQQAVIERQRVSVSIQG